MFSRHVDDELSAYYHQELSGGEARRVAEHLAGCARCRAAFDEIRRGIHLAEQLPTVEAPETLWPGIERELAAPEPVEAAPARAGLGLGWGLTGALALVLVVALGLSWYFGFRQKLYMYEEAGPITEFESAARDMHLRLTSGREPLEFPSTNPASVRDWVQGHTPIISHLADRPGNAALQVEMLGAGRMEAAGAPTAVVFYRVNEQPATLITARVADVRDGPSNRLFSKDIYFRQDPELGLKLLTWQLGGQAYVLVSTAPGYGQQACLVCHTQPETRQIILSARPERMGN